MRGARPRSGQDVRVAPLDPLSLSVSSISIHAGRIEILHIHHTARQAMDGLAGSRFVDLTQDKGSACALR